MRGRQAGGARTSPTFELMAAAAACRVGCRRESGDWEGLCSGPGKGVDAVAGKMERGDILEAEQL